MKKAPILILLIVVFVWVYKGQLSNNKKENNANIVPTVILHPTITPVNSSQSSTSSIFVPYWALGQDNLSSIPQEKVYYFGVSAGLEGLNKDDVGYINLEHGSCPNDKTCVLVLRMLDSSLNQQILESRQKQESLIREVLETANAYYYSGVALDLEMSGLSSINTKSQISKFVEYFSTAVKKDYKSFSFIIYGDSYFRKRPYDLKSIGAQSDEIMIMAYDFHKSYGEPGPNYPFGDFEKWGYDFRAMIFDFATDIPKEKLTVIFGMYGYDWTLNKQGTPLKRAQALSLNQINALRAETSDFKITSTHSREKKGEYMDTEGLKHVVWYEDEDSVSVKEEFLMQQGIKSVSYWAWGYF